jgi:tetratricopeptide (TPR) repeat protein
MEADKMFDYSLQATFSFVNMLAQYKEDRNFDVYGLIGAGLSNWESEWRVKPNGPVLGASGGTSASNGPLEMTTEGFMPVGLGLSYKITDGLSLTFEEIWKPVNSDMLDVKTGGLEYDTYSTSTLGLSYNLGELGGFGKMVKNYHTVSYTAEPAVMERHGDKVEITLNGNFPEDYFSKKAAMKITPKLVYGQQTKTLEPVVVRGEKVTGDGKVITDAGGNFKKTYTIDFEEGMEDAELYMTTLVYLPKGNPVNEDATDSNIQENYRSEMLPQRFVAEGTIITGQRVLFDPSMAAASADDNAATPDYGMTADHGYEKVTIVSDEATVYFKINLAYLNWRLPLNIENNAKNDVEELKQFISQGWEIKDIEINAWASPEGETDFNASLSEDRAETGLKVLKDLLQNAGVDAEEVTIVSNARGEDWNGFVDAVEASNIKDKNIILNVVRSQPDLEKREQEIRNMALVYAEIEEDILPPLRRVALKVNSFEPKKTDEEIAELALTDPEQLDKAELLYSGTLHADLDKKLEIYNKATELYPNCARAFNNKGYVLLMKGEIGKAEKCLLKAEKLAPTHGGVLNNLGVVYGAKGDFDKAEAYFNKAKAQGINVDYSLGVIEITKGNYDKALRMMKNKACDYNVGLAQLVSGDTEKAEKTLKCGADKAANNYLLAVTGARKGDKDMVFDYLVKAVKADAAYKEIAKKDKEFLKYFAMPEFKSLVE